MDSITGGWEFTAPSAMIGEGAIRTPLIGMRDYYAP